MSQISESDSMEVMTLINASQEANYINADSARDLANKALELSNQLSYQYGVAHSYNRIGITYQVLGIYDSALLHLMNSLEIWESKKDSFEIANVLNNIGIVYDEKGMDDQAITYYTNSLRIYEALNTPPGMAKVYNNLGIIYKKNRQYDKVISYYLKSLKIYEEMDHGFGIAATKGNLGSAYLELKKYDLSIEYSKESIVGYEEEGIDQFIPYSLENIGLAYRGLDQIEEAKKYHEEALMLYKAYGNRKESAFTLGSLSEISMDQSDYSNAKKNAEEAFSIASLIGTLEELKRASSLLTRSNIYLNNSVEANQSLSNFISYSDSLNNQERNSAIAEVQVKYETEKKDQEIKTLAAESELQELKIAQSRWVLLIIVMLAFLLIVGLMLFNSRKRYKMKAALADERDRIQKNRFKAVLEAEEKERKRIAQELHDGLGQILSTARLSISSLDEDEQNKSVQHSLKLIDTAVNETRTISHNMMPNALVSLGLEAALQDLIRNVNMSGGIKAHINIEQLPQVDEATSVAVYRIVQEIINNTLKYAEASEVSVNIKTSDQINLEIVDNGKGFDTSNIENSDGIGWKNIYSRAEMMNGNVSVYSKLREGTKVQIILPLYESSKNPVG